MGGGRKGFIGQVNGIRRRGRSRSKEGIGLRNLWNRGALAFWRKGVELQTGMNGQWKYGVRLMQVSLS